MRAWIVVWIVLLLLLLYNPFLAVFISMVVFIASFVIYQGLGLQTPPYRWMAWSPYPNEVEVRSANEEYRVREKASGLAASVKKNEDVLIPSISFLVFLFEFIIVMMLL